LSSSEELAGILIETRMSTLDSFKLTLQRVSRYVICLPVITQAMADPSVL